MEWQPEHADQVLRLRPWRAVSAPVRDRRFVYARYDALLERLADPTRFRVVPHRELASVEEQERVVVAVRHDVDLLLDHALEMARAEAARALRTTYFILHTAPYYGVTEEGRAEHDPDVLPKIHALQDLGHEVGWHNDLVTLQAVYGVEPRAYLARELQWLRDGGVDVVGTAAHGSYWCHALGFRNEYFFAGAPAEEGFPNIDAVVVDGRRVPLAKGTLEEFGLEYETARLGHDRFYSDARFDEAGRRWHPEELELDELRPGERVVILLHPCTWDSSAAAKWGRTLGQGAARASELALSRVRRRAS